MSSSSNLHTVHNCRRSLLLALLALPFAGLGHASLPVGLRRMGSGTFRRFGFPVYEATLWAGDNPLRPPLALRLDYKRNIAGPDIAAASVKEMRKLVADKQQLDAWGERMVQIFPDIRDGDHILGIWQADGAHFMQGDRMLGSIAEPEFARAFFGIWLDERTSAPDLRATLLNPPSG
jgi:hypothetical protein